jgi:ABC-type glucose/galactose transport system permease subunit
MLVKIMVEMLVDIIEVGVVTHTVIRVRREVTAFLATLTALQIVYGPREKRSTHVGGYKCILNFGQEV